jgi:hypothetical protein
LQWTHSLKAPDFNKPCGNWKCDILVSKFAFKFNLLPLYGKAHNMKHFSIWPDLTSSWRWQVNKSGGWELTRLRWRFLLKKVFPDIESSLQLVCL